MINQIDLRIVKKDGSIMQIAVSASIHMNDTVITTRRNMYILESHSLQFNVKWAPYSFGCSGFLMLVVCLLSSLLNTEENHLWLHFAQ